MKQIEGDNHVLSDTSDKLDMGDTLTVSISNYYYLSARHDFTRFANVLFALGR